MASPRSRQHGEGMPWGTSTATASDVGTGKARCCTSVVKGDSALVRAQKHVWMVLLTCAVVCGPLAVVFSTSTQNLLLRYLGVAMLPTCGALLAYQLLMKSITPVFMACGTLVLVVAVTLYDLSALASGHRAWTLFVVLLDALLVSRAPHRLRTCVVAWVLLWVSVTWLELTTRFGLLDFEFMTPYDLRQRYCEKPPCATGVADVVRDLLLPVVVFLIDYNATRGFANAVAEETAKVEAAITTARYIAGCLAQFDLEGAEEILDETHEPSCLPRELHNTFEALLSNLKEYKPFLPPSLLPERDHDDPTSPISSADGNAHPRFPNARISRRQSNGSARSSESSGNDSSSGTTTTTSPGSDTDRQPRQSAFSERLGLSSGGGGGVHIRSTTTTIIERAGKLVTPATVRPYLEAKRVSLAVTTVRLEAADDYSDIFLPRHEKYVSTVLNLMAVHKGVLYYFTGDRICSTFNAFCRFGSHCAGALRLAIAARAELDADYNNAACAAVSGQVMVGNLGTPIVRRPVVLGTLTVVLDQVVEAGALLECGIVCTQPVFAGVSIEFPLRILLHRVGYSLPVDAREMEGGADGLLYTVDVHGLQEDADANANARSGGDTVRADGDRLSPSMGGAAAGGTRRTGAGRLSVASGDPQDTAAEWMYVLQTAPGRVWEDYNTAGLRFHTAGGLPRALDYLTRRATPAARQLFQEHAAAAELLDLTPRFAPLPATPGSGGGARESSRASARSADKTDM